MTSIEMCLALYQRHPKFHKSLRNLESILHDFRFMMRLDKNATYSELREYISIVSNGTSYVIPNEKVIREEISRVLSLVLNGVIYGNLKKLSLFHKESMMILDHLPDYLKVISPIGHALKNSVSSLTELNNQLDTRSYNLEKVIDLLVLTDPLLLGKGERKSKQSLTAMSKLGRLFRMEWKLEEQQVNTQYRLLQVKKGIKVLNFEFRKSFPE